MYGEKNMKPDLLICHIKHCYYPIWMKTVKKYRDFFGKILIHFSEHNRQPYFDHYIHTELQELGNIVFLDKANIDWSTQDWRNIATNEMLKYSTGEWVCSIEQDWFCRDWDKLLAECRRHMDSPAALFGWYSLTAHSYVHPAFFFIRRAVLDQTSKDFGPHSEISGSDHFAKITYDVEKLEQIVVGLNVGDVSSRSLAFHLGGVNQNYLDGIHTGVFHREEIFYIYNYWSMKHNLPSDFAKRCLRIETILKNKYPDIDPEKSEWSEFFK